MSRFRTIVTPPQFERKIDYQSKIVMLGSCFTENIGEKLGRLKFNIDINPFGIIYNPVSVKNSLQLLLTQRRFVAEDLFEHSGLWNSWFHHSRYSSADCNSVLENINRQIDFSSNALKEAGFLLVTFGTAWVYQLKESGQVVSNCHKVPASKFRRFRLTADEIVEVYEELFGQLWAVNPGLKVVFTVSPVRHWKDGAVENQLSKATLLLSIDRLVQQFGKERVAYFPAYEMVMDDLRDYRFYDEDMLHLNGVAVDYIWERFCESLIEKKEHRVMDKVEKIIRATEHRPFNSSTPEFRKFLERQLEQAEVLMQDYQWLNLKKEKDYFLQKIKNSHT